MENVIPQLPLAPNTKVGRSPAFFTDRYNGTFTLDRGDNRVVPLQVR